MKFAAVLKWLLVLLLIANLAVLAAWLGPPQLRAMGALPPAVPQQRELARLALPASEGSAAAASSVAPDAGDARAAVPEPAELPAASEATAATATQPPAMPPPAMPETEALRCALVGPFPDQAAAQAARERIVAGGGSAQLQAEENLRYTVLLPPAASAAAAGRTRQALRAQGIDAYVMPAGQNRNGISVGVFQSRARALAQRQRVAGLGYAAQVVESTRPAAYRLLARAPAGVLAGLPQAACKPPVAAGSEGV